MVSASNFVSVDKDVLSTSTYGFLPKLAVIPLCEDYSESYEILVSEGDKVEEGQVIARSAGLYIHSSIPGIVKKIERRQYSNGKQGLAAVISLKGEFSFLGKKQIAQEWRNYDSITVQFLLKEAGLVNTFDKSLPLYTQIKKIKNEKSSFLVLRLFDSDPSIITESYISKNYLKEVLEGACIIARAFGVKHIIIACPMPPKNCPEESFEEFKDSIFKDDFLVDTVNIDVKKYPAGTMHDITCTAKKTLKGENFSKLGKKDLFIDSITALNAYNSLVLRKPIVSTFVHVTGDSLNSSAILNVRIGTSFSDLAEQCGGFKRGISQIVVNGILFGTAVSNLEIPVNRGVKSVEFIPVGKVKIQNTENCVRCGYCRKICPVNLWPGNLYRIAHLDSMETACQADKTAYNSVVLCTECGLCNAVCSSRIPLSQTISLLKEKYNEEQR